MRSYEDAMAAARDEPAFSNGTAWEIWSYNWCERCKHDSPELVDRGQGCPLIMVALMGKTPIEWLAETGAARLMSDYHCAEFREDRGDDGDEPEPEPRWDPEMPGQIDLFTAATLDGIEAELRTPAEVSRVG